MPLADGQVIAGYTILRSLGAGGMGEVYLAQHPRLPRRDALKVLPAAVCRRQASIGSGSTARPTSRPRCGTRTSSRSTTAATSTASCGSRWTTSRAPTPARLLRERYPDGMPPDEVVRIVTAVAEALDYAHQRGLLHRDVKPANILLSQSRRPRIERIMLADFGIARWVDDASGLTGTNMTVGTVAYAAPEQLMGEEIDGRADQYALAATAFQLLTGTPPFQHSNPAVVISQAPHRRPTGDRHPAARVVRPRTGIRQGAGQVAQRSI